MSGRERQEDWARCRKCRFGVPVFLGEDELMMACTKVLYTGRPRPCPQGRGCTEFQEK